MKSNEKLLFLHIPKTGGTTFNHILYQNFAHSEQFKINPVDKKVSFDLYNVLSDRKKDRIKLFRGHFYYGIHDKLDISNYRYVTIVRDPVKRIISHYFYSKNFQKHYLYETLNSNNTSSFDYFSGKFNFEVINGQTAQIAGFDPDQSNLDRVDIIKYLYSNELYEKAIANIEKDFSFVGLTEQFDQTLLLLNYLHEFNNFTLHYSRKNVAKKINISKKIRDNEIDIIISNNLLDIRLYQYIKSKNDAIISLINNTQCDYSKTTFLHRFILFQLKFFNRYFK